jgi:hypothetical protein
MARLAFDSIFAGLDAATVVVFWPKQLARRRKAIMPGRQPPVRYKVAVPIHAVRLEAHSGSSLSGPTGTLVEIPAEAIVEVEGQAARSGLVNVLWNGEAYSVFYEDLQEKAHIVSSAGT